MTDHILDRALGRDLRAASDAQLSQVLALIDAMPARGAADALIEGVRPRLARLRPERPVSLARVLFAPLDTLIAAPRDWRPGAVTIPRSLLGFVSRPALERLAALRTELEASLKGVAATNADAVLEAGRKLWPAASSVIAELPCASDWRAQTGLAETEWFELRESVAAILARAVQIEEIVADVAGEHALEQLLASAATCTSVCLARLVRILVTRHPRPGELTTLVAQIQDPRWRAAADVALSDAADEAIGLFERTATDSAEAAADKAAQLAAMLDAVDAPARHKRVQEARTKIAAACQQRLGAVLRDDVVACLAGPARGDGVESVERSARNASKLEAASRALDPQSRAQALLQTAALDVVALRSDGLDDVDRVRLVEILLGPEEAMRVATNLANAGASNATQQGRRVQW